MDDNDATLRANLAAFHHNFSRGEIERNGDLVQDDVDVVSNNVQLRGRDAFAERLKRYETPFPGLQLRDRIRIVEGRAGAVLYLLQGKHNGPYAGEEGTGRHIEAYSGELFDFDDSSRLTRLHTITQLDRVTAQVRGGELVAEHQEVDVLPITPVTDQLAAAIRSKAVSLFEAEGPSPEHGRTVIASDAALIIDGRSTHGPAAWVELWERWTAAFSDLQVTVDRQVQEGDRIAVRYRAVGTHDGPFNDRHGATHTPTGKQISWDGIDFLRFDESELVTELVAVHNSDDIVSQIEK